MADESKAHRFKRLEHLFHSAKMMDEVARVNYLAHECGSDEALRCEIETLLAAQLLADDFLSVPATDLEARRRAGRLAPQSFDDKLPVKTESLLGRTVNQYEIVSLLGFGGMGEVWLANDTRLKRKVALKLLPEEFTNEADRVRRFEQEAHAVLALNHPNIITLFDFGHAEEGYFITTEFVDGRTLRERLRESASLPVQEAIEIVLQVCSALAAAHKAGIIHRDIKPENVMLRRDGFVKVLDFGLAKKSEDQMLNLNTSASSLTNPGVVMGTVSYMSPEQARGQKVDARTDIFSLGVVLFELLAGRSPFEGEAMSDRLASLLRDEPPSLVQLNPDLPDALNEIVQKALAKQREARWDSAKAFANALRVLAHELEFESRLAHSELATPTAASTQARTRLQIVPTSSARLRMYRGRYLVVGVICLVVILLGLMRMTWWATRKSERSFTNIQIRRLTSSSDAFEAAISPDGRLVSYILKSGLVSLWLRNLSTGREMQLIPPALGNIRGLAFSRDGNFIYYSQRRQNDSVHVLYQLPVTGGMPVRVLPGVDSAISFSPDGKQIAFVREDQTTKKSALMISHADGLEERRLAVCFAPDNYSVDGPSWSPDGKLIAIAKMIPAPDFHFSLIAVRVSDGLEQPIGETRWAWMMRVAWLNEGSELAVVGRLKRREAITQLWSVNYPNGELQRITNDLNDYRNVSLAGNKLVTVRSELRANIWTTQPDLAGNARQITNAPTDRNGLGLDWTQDGRLVYTSDAGGGQNLWVMNADGSQSKKLTTDSDDHDRFAGISSYGKYVVFTSARSGAGHIWRVGLDGSGLMELTRGTNDLKPQYSPDGKWIVYSAESPKQKSQRNIVKLWASDPPGEPIPLTDKFSDYPVVSPDGQWVVCLYKEDAAFPSKIALFSLAGGEPMRFLDIPTFPQPVVRWHPSGRGVCYLDSKDNLTNVWFFPLSGGASKKLTHFQGEQIFEYAWARDGHSLACTRGTENRDVVLIEGLLQK